MSEEPSWSPTVDSHDKEDKFRELWRQLLEDPQFTGNSEFLWDAVCGDDPDLLVLRFMRARKWDPAAAYTMLARAMKWRQEFGVKEIREADLPKEQFELNKFYFYQRCKEGRPIGWIHVRLHEKDACPIEDLKRWTIFLMETGRQLFLPPVEKITLVFDMTGFSLKNMDFPFVAFLAQCFEAFYPESLGVALLVNAPWIFSGCWKIISPLLDPVVRNKVQFIGGDKLKDYIDEGRIVAVMNGPVTTPFTYTPIQPALSTDEAERTRMLEERHAIERDLTENTQWLVDNWSREEGRRAEVLAKYAERAALKARLRENFLVMSKFREPTPCHRAGIIRDEGRTVSWE